MKRTQIFEAALVAIALSSFALLDAQATIYTVNTSSDSVVPNACENHLSGCSLRGAILAANAHSGDTIVFNIFELCGINGCVINLLSALPDISAPMSISGPSTHAIQRSSSAATGNSALRCGGISTAGGAAAGLLTVTNSTIVGNSSFYSDSAGGISKDGEGGPVNIKNTIVALSTGSAGRDVFSAFASSGYNLIGKTDGSTGFTQPTDQTGTIAAPLDPKLDPAGLQNNGGPTQTIALQPGSPALDKGTSSGLTGSLTTDQRGNGFPRMADYSNIANAAGGDGTDVGAFEGTPLQITAITRLVNAHLLLQGRGTPNRPHIVEASPDLSPNSFVAFPNPTMADGTGALQYEDVPQAGVPKQFYRLRFP